MPAAKKTSTTKKAATKKPAAKKASTAKKTTAAAKKPAVPASANTSMKVTAAEKKLVESYRGASSDLKKIAVKVLKGDYGDTVTKLLNAVGGGNSSSGINLGDTIGNLLGGLIK